MVLSGRPGLVHWPEPSFRPVFVNKHCCLRNAKQQWLMAVLDKCWFMSRHWSNCPSSTFHSHVLLNQVSSLRPSYVLTLTRPHQEFSNFVITLPHKNTYIPPPATFTGHRKCSSAHCSRSVSGCTVTEICSKCSFTVTKQIAKCFASCSYIFRKHQPVCYILVTVKTTCVDAFEF